MKQIGLFTAAGLGLALIFAAMPALAEGNVPQRPTFTKDILPILQDNCQACHRPSGLNMSGMVAPMSLMTYQEVRPWARAIERTVVSKEMPPWHASEVHHGQFENERSLTEAEIQTIVRWVKGRAPMGNPADAPPPVEFSQTGWNFGEPDLVVSFDEPFFVEDDVEDLYHNITVKIPKEDLPEDRWIQAIEFKPGSPVVHHIIGYATPPGKKVEAEGEEGAQTRGMLGGMAPGSDEERFPEGYGILLPAESQITFAMHYHKESGPGTGVDDVSHIGFKFHPKDAVVNHPIEISTIANGRFEIPPYHAKWRVGASRTFPEDTVLLGMLPHLHLRGLSAKYTAFYPDGESELLLDVPLYDFNWQTGYKLAEKKIIPAGTRIEMDFYYDNSGERAAEVGFNPNRSVRFGGPTTDEMDLAWITIAPAEPIESPTASGGD